MWLFISKIHEIPPPMLVLLTNYIKSSLIILPYFTLILYILECLILGNKFIWIICSSFVLAITILIFYEIHHHYIYFIESFLKLKISSLCLVKLDTLKQGFEISCTKPLMIVSLNELNKHCWSILQWLGENLLKQNKSTIIIIYITLISLYTYM